MLISQKSYLMKVLIKFNTLDANLVSDAMNAHFRLSTNLSPKNEAEESKMQSIPYASDVGV